MKLQDFYCRVGPFLLGEQDHPDAVLALYGSAPPQPDAERLAIYGRFCRNHRHEVLDGIYVALRALVVARCGEERWDPVSYTHLDVYKRQGQGTTVVACARLYECAGCGDPQRRGLRRPVRFALSGAGEPALPGGDPSRRGRGRGHFQVVARQRLGRLPPGRAHPPDGHPAEPSPSGARRALWAATGRLGGCLLYTSRCV